MNFRRKELYHSPYKLNRPLSRLKFRACTKISVLLKCALPVWNQISLKKEQRLRQARKELAPPRPSRLCLRHSLLGIERIEKGLRQISPIQVFSDTVFSIPQKLGEPSLALRNIMEATVSEDTVTIHAMFALGTHRNSVRYSLAKHGEAWKIATEERLSPKIKGEPTVVDVRLDGCAPLSELETAVEGNVAMTVENSSEGRHYLILKKVPENLDLRQLLQGGAAKPSRCGGTSLSSQIRKAGETMNVAFTQSLQPGRYALVCYPHGSADAEYGDAQAEEIVATVTVN